MKFLPTSGVSHHPHFLCYNYTLYKPNCQVFFQEKRTFFAKFSDFSRKFVQKMYFFLFEARNSAEITDKSRQIARRDTQFKTTGLIAPCKNTCQISCQSSRLSRHPCFTAQSWTRRRGKSTASAAIVASLCGGSPDLTATV